MTQSGIAGSGIFKHGYQFGHLAALACSASVIVPVQSSATTLNDALLAAYQRNPTLTAQRAAVRAADENVPIARAAGLPTLDSTVTYQENVIKGDTPIGGFTSDPDRQIVASANLSVPLVTFGAVTGAVRAAEARVTASEFGLRSTESELFTAVVGAYLDVIRDEAVVRLNLRNFDVLTYVLKETRARNQSGERPDSDVAQAEAREALAASQLETARAKLIGSREAYVRFVGQPAGALEPPPPLPILPGDPDSAVAVAVENNPALLTARANAKAAKQDVRAVTGERFPKVNAIAGVNRFDYLGSLAPGTSPRNNEKGTSAFVGVQFRMPIYQGGREFAQIRQANAREQQATEQIAEAERKAVADTRSAYATWQAANRVVVNAQRGSSANERALVGIRAQTKVGIRPLIDQLNAEQELLNAQVTQVTANRDAYVAAFALLAAIGQAQASNLNFDTKLLYDPSVYYARVRRLAFQTKPDPQTPPVATGTKELPAQDAEVRSPMGPFLQRP